MEWTRRNVREYSLPHHFTVRPYRLEDRAAWIRLWRAGGLCLTDDDETEYQTNVMDLAQLGFEPLRDTILVCGGGGVPVATISAFIRTDEKELGSGYITQVSADPSVRGMGVGSAMLSIVMRRMYDIGCEKVILLTQDYRLPAIKSYLNQGFEPSLSGEGMAARWDAIYQNLGLPNPRKNRAQSENNEHGY